MGLLLHQLIALTAWVEWKSYLKLLPTKLPIQVIVGDREAFAKTFREAALIYAIDSELDKLVPVNLYPLRVVGNVKERLFGQISTAESTKILKKHRWNHTSINSNYGDSYQFEKNNLTSDLNRLLDK
ncbi:MAG: hypothetical protein NZ108_02925 [Bacteroidia bacterium]|nr:hypothetical protein [Bacteroidia bacterium]